MVATGTKRYHNLRGNSPISESICAIHWGLRLCVDTALARWWNIWLLRAKRGSFVIGRRR